MLYALVNYQGDQDVFNISSNTATSQNDVLQIIKKLLPELEVAYFPARSVDAHKIMLDNSKIKKVEEFRLVEIEQGIRLYYEYIKQHKRESK